jgi:hypothetical protein
MRFLLNQKLKVLEYIINPLEDFMESYEFFVSLEELPSSYSFGVRLDKSIVGETNRGSGRGVLFNPITAVAFRKTGQVFGTNKRESQKAGRALGLNREFVNQLYDATNGVSNRGNAQVVRGKIKSALGV